MLACNAFDELDAQAASMSEDLLSWDFLQDLDFDVDQATDGKAQAQVLRSHFTSTERVREQKRKAQQRARQKKKVGRERHARDHSCQPLSSSPCVCLGTISKHRGSTC